MAEGLKLNNLVKELLPAISKYYSIGLQLQISEEILKKIEKDHADTDRRFIEVLSHWLNNGDTITWDTVIGVLESPLVGHKRLATTLREKCIKSTTTQGVLSQQSDHFLSDSAYRSQSQSQTSQNSCDALPNPSPSTFQPRVKYPPPPPVEPLDGSVIDIHDTLKEFSYAEFHPNQEKIITNIVSGISTLAVLPVGSGKSLCYQIPAYLYSKHRSPCISLVISPLISLMEDQVQNFPSGLRGEYYHANLKKDQRDKVLKDAREGKIDVLLLSPEALMGGALWGNCGNPCLEGYLHKIAFVCIDEAHCVSEWSHNFRPAYFRIQKVLERLGVKCVLGLTATATHETAVSVARCFNINPENGIIRDGSILPSNLRITVSCENNKYEALVNLLESPKFVNFGSVIVYCNRQYLTEEIAEKLRTDLRSLKLVGSSNSKQQLASNSMSKKRLSTDSSASKRRRVKRSVGYYHGDMEPDERDKVHKAFMEGRIHVVVATEAFGVGLNKKDVRAIIHYDIPKSIELYVQEIGRAGRDGKTADCHAFVDDEGSDLYILRHHVYNSTTDKTILQLLVDKLSQCPETLTQSSQECNGHDVAISIDDMEKVMDIYGNCISTLLCYLEQQGYLEIKHVTKDKCTLKCSGGQTHLDALAKKVSIVKIAAAVNEDKKNEGKDGQMTFSVSNVAKIAGQDEYDVYLKLSELQYKDHGVGGQAADGTMNTVSVEFSSQIFHIHSRTGLFSDSVCEDLHGKVKKQEESNVQKLHLLHGVLRSIKSSDSDSNDTKCTRESTLKGMIQSYFDSEQLDMPQFCTTHGISILPVHQEITPAEQQQIEHDVHTLAFNYDAARFTGRTIARIFYGLRSPLFQGPKLTKSGFWKKYISVNFNQLCQIATEKLEELEEQNRSRAT